MTLGRINTYNPKHKGSFPISRSKIDLFLECPRCFYLDRRVGIQRPPQFPYTLNSAVDILLKKEFDIHRAKNTQHPLMKKYGIAAVPFSNNNLNEWRENFVGIRHTHKPTNLIIFGAVDDIWINREQELMVVDYKSTSINENITTLNKAWHDGYKRQLEVYQWLLKQNNYKVSKTGFFVYCNGKKDSAAFDGKLEFDLTIIPYIGDDTWIEKTLIDIKKCLDSIVPPKPRDDCRYCYYVDKIEHMAPPNLSMQ